MTPGNPTSLSYLFQLVFGLYMLVTTVVLINLLIAYNNNDGQMASIKLLNDALSSILKFNAFNNDNNLYISSAPPKSASSQSSARSSAQHPAIQVATNSPSAPVPPVMMYGLFSLKVALVAGWLSRTADSRSLLVAALQL